MIVEIEDMEIIEFKLASDGWYEYSPKCGIGLAINPTKTICVTDPWEADYICDAPTHKIIRIIEE